MSSVVRKGVLFPKVDINSCEYKQLLLLPGVGTATAQNILVLRDSSITITKEIASRIPYFRPTEAFFESVRWPEPFDTSNLTQVGAELYKTILQTEQECADAIFALHYQVEKGTLQNCQEFNIGNIDHGFLDRIIKQEIETDSGNSYDTPYREFKQDLVDQPYTVRW